MKKIILICDTLLESGLLKWLENQAHSGAFSDLCPPRTTPQVQSISNENCWNATSFSAAEEKQIIQVIILQELNATDWPTIRSGHKVAELLLQRNDLKHQTLNLQFISLHSRRELWDKAPALYRPFVKSFPHLQFLPDRITPINFSTRRYEYIRNYCLVDNGHLDILAHDLERYLYDKSPAETLIEQIRHTLELGRLIVGDLAYENAEGLIELLIRNPSPENCRLVQAQHLPVLIAQIKQKRDENAPPPTYQKLPYRALIVEDDPGQLKKLETELLLYFDEVSGLCNGEQACEALKKGDYHALFVDMELLDESGFDQPVTGVDLLDFCENEELPVATRIVTALGRRGLKALVDKPESHILHKSHAHSILGGNDNLPAFFDKLAQEIKKKEEQLKRPTPSRGPFGEGKQLKKLYIRMATEREEELKQMLEEIRQKAVDFFYNPGGTGEVTTRFRQTQRLGREDDDLILLRTVLLHRAIALLKTKDSPDGYLHYGKFTDYDPDADWKYKGLHDGYCDLFHPPLGDNAKSYFSIRLGFSGEWEIPKKNVRSHVWVKVHTNDLFKEEDDWFQSLDMARLKEKPLSEASPMVFKGICECLKCAAKKPEIAHTLLTSLLKIKDLRQSSLDDFCEEFLDAGVELEDKDWLDIDRKLRGIMKSNTLL